MYRYLDERERISNYSVTMEAEPQAFHVGTVTPNSRTLTPTASVRPRPRPPVALSVRSRSIEHPMTDDMDSTGVDDLAGALTELGRTDFVRKYSRKSRPVRPGVHSTATTPASPTADIDIRSAASSPVVHPAALRYQRLRSPVQHASAGFDSAVTRCNADNGDGGTDAPANTDNRHHIPTQRDVDARRLVDQSQTCGTRLDVQHSDDVKQTVSLRTSERNPRAGTGLFRSESDSSKMRSFTLRSLRPKTMASRQSQTVTGVPPPVPRDDVTTSLVDSRITTNSEGSTDRSGVETDDEGVGAVDIDEPSFKDTYMSVTTPGSGDASSNRTAILPSLQQFRDTQFVAGSAAGGMECHQRFAVPVTETSSPLSGTTTQKTNTGGRFLTHPPLRERSVARQQGSVDSNGLGALRDVSDPAKQVLCLASQVSVSSADSHICPSEDSTSLSHFGGDANVELGTTTPVTVNLPSPDQLVRKNSKTQKLKSRSDPTRGEKNGDGSVVDIPSIVSGTMHAQSSPILLDDDDDDENRRRQQSTTPTQFPFTVDSASTSDLSDRGRDVTTIRDSQLTVGDDSAKSSPSESMHDVAVRVVLKSDDSFEEVPTTSVKPPRPKITKKRPRAPPSPLTTQINVGPADTSSSLVRKVFSKDRNSDNSTSDGRLQTKDADDQSEELSAASSLTLPLSKKSTLLRSHSSAGNGTVSGVSGSGGLVASSRSKHSELPQSLAISRQRSPGAPDSVGVVSRNGVVTASASVPELCDVSSGNISRRTLHSKNHNSLSASYTPSLEPVLSNSTSSLFDGPAGDKVVSYTKTNYPSYTSNVSLCFDWLIMQAVVFIYICK